MKIDLHSHSTCSDGTYSPSDLVLLARQVGITHFALTDHDTIVGLDEARNTACAMGIKLINGVEISCHHTMLGGYGKNKSLTKTIHVVALGFDNVEALDEKLRVLQESRESRGRQIVTKLFALLSDDKTVDSEQTLWQKVLTKAGGNPKAVGRAHIAQVLHEMGIVRTVQDAFDKYLADDKSAYVPIDTLTMQQTIALIHECGGLAVLAHPTRYHLSATRVRRLISEFACYGGDAIELPAPTEPVSTRTMIDRCVSEHNLLVSTGSDFHGTTMPWRKLGQVATLGAGQVGVWSKINLV